MARSLLQVPADARQSEIVVSPGPLRAPQCAGSVHSVLTYIGHYLVYVKDPRQETRVLELNAGKGSTRR
jgi:hypothetical protein